MLRRFASCPHQFGLSLEEPRDEEVGSLTTLGSVFHYTIDVYETTDHNLGAAKATFEHYWRYPEQLGLRVDFWHQRTSWSSLFDRGITMLERYDEAGTWRKGRLIGTEIGFSVPLGNHTLTGHIDQLWDHPGTKTLEVVDLKTGANVEDKLRWNVQFTAYCYGTERPEFWANGRADRYTKYRDYVRVGRLYHLRSGRVHDAGPREEIDYRRLLRAVDAMDEAVTLGVFPLNISGPTCGYCPYTDRCGMDVEDPRRV